MLAGTKGLQCTMKEAAILGHFLYDRLGNNFPSSMKHSKQLFNITNEDLCDHC